MRTIILIFIGMTAAALLAACAGQSARQTYSKRTYAAEVPDPRTKNTYVTPPEFTYPTTRTYRVE